MKRGFLTIRLYLKGFNVFIRLLHSREISNTHHISLVFSIFMYRMEMNGFISLFLTVE